MSVSYYGIYIGYHPGVDLRYEGLGRQLAAFIKGAEENKRVRFVIVCPSWSQKAILELFISEGVNANTVDIVRPKGQSVILSLYAKYNNYVGQKKLTKKSWHPILKLNEWINFGEVQLLEKLMTVRNLFSFSMYGLLWLFFIPIRLSMQSISILSRAVRRIVRIPEKLNPYVKRIQKILLNPKKSIILSNCYQLIEQKENQLMIELINKMTYVKAWYSPTAFWPYFNQIRAPKLMCVPDVVLTEFPVEFAILGGEPLVQMFKKVETSIKQGEYFVTYSQHIKDSILIEKYGINSEKIKVIPHSANKLDHLITIQGYGAAVDRTRRYSQQLLLSALKKSTYVEYTKNFNNTEVKYLFYASQFRPSKNIITLLRAYKYLLRNHFLGHKLILTGRPDILKEIDEYIDDNLLNYDVILIPQLTVKELAATYHLADLAINPSLSEGGCPFTFTEALSVDTPAIMADISVTREVIQDTALQKLMLFDPYNWRDLAKKILWALENKESLLSQQKTLYNQLKKRTWTTVVDEHIQMLDSISLSETEDYSQMA